MNRWLGALLALMVFFLLPSVSHALTDDQKALVGLKGVMATLEDLDPEVERLGLTPDQLKTDIELRLRKAGIRVLTEKEWLRTSGKPWFHISITTLYSAIGPGIWSITINAKLNELVTLARGFQVFGAIWDKNLTGTVATAKVPQMRNKVGDVVDKFINDYLAANPK